MTLHRVKKTKPDLPWHVFKYGFSFYRGDESSLGKRPQRQTEIGIGFIFKGSSLLAFGGRTEKIGAKQLHVIWGAVPHHTTWFAPGTSFGAVAVPLAWFISWDLPGEFVQRVLDGEFVREPDPAAREKADESLMRQWEHDLSPGHEGNSHRIAAKEIEARLMRLADAVLSKNAPPPAHHPPAAPPGLPGSSIDRMTSFIVAHFQEPIGVREIAEAAGLNPAYAMRQFRKLWGTTMGNFLLQHRLWCAQSLLVTTRMKIVEVAEKSGFGSTAQFHELFRRNLHQTPADYRRQH